MKVKQGKDKILFDTLGYIIMGLFAALCIIPFYLVVIGSLTSERAIITEGYSLFLKVKNISLEGYKVVLKDPMTIVKAYGVTIFVTLVGTTFSIIINTMTGYVLSRKDFPWRNGVSFFFFFTTLFSGGLVPWYLMCSKVLHFNNHIYALIIPGLFSVWNMIISKSFMKGIPFEMTEAAKVDGAGDFKIYYQVIIPMAKPLIATIGLFTALAYWNDWYNCMLFMTKDSFWNLQYTLQNILNSSDALKRIASMTGMQVQQMPTESMKMAMTVIATGPIILLYPSLQKYFVKGLTIGAVKG